MLQRLFPLPGEPTTITDSYLVERPQLGERPWIALCMVASIDGSTVLEGASRKLSCATDREVMLTLRSVADMIIVGAGTVRAEGYRAPKKPGQRIGVVSLSGRVDVNTDLFTSGAGFLITTEDAPDTGVETVRAGASTVDLRRAVCALPGSPTVVQAEGGASLNGALAQADLIDEINLTTSPLLVGGGGSRALRGGDVEHRYRLAHLLEDEGFLFSRYVRAEMSATASGRPPQA